MAYDGDGVRQQLDQRGTKPIVPTTQQKAPARLQQAPKAPASAPKLMRS
jgi:hypothetical protein